MRFRHLLLAAAIIAAFVYLTTYSPMRPFGPGNWRGPLPWERGASRVPNVTLAQGERFSSDEQNNIEVYKAASPAVVNITTVTLAYDFFLNAVPVESGAGSGFLIDADGDIVTNYHVISGARQVQVTMADKGQFKAQVVGADPRSDLAVVRVSAEKKLPYLQLGDSKNLQVGQKVLAIGNPFGQFQNTLTTGVVSSLGRSVRDPDSRNVLEDVIQTDAAINPGNSGGPLLDSHGRVIGINTAIVGPTNLGIGFAIPVNRIKLIVGDLLREGRVLRPYLGVATLPISKDLAGVLELPVDQGLLVVRVEPGSPADKAGIRGGGRAVIVGTWEIPVGGDIVVQLDGEPMIHSEDLLRRVENKRVGETVKVTVFRGSKRLDVSVQLQARPGNRF
jgi:S1-C subfamily serine protease